MSNTKQSYYLKCVAQAGTLQEAPSRLQLSVRQPGCCCFPWFARKWKIASFSFRDAAWKHGPNGEYEHVAECEVTNMTRLRGLQADLPVRVKTWTKGRATKALLKASLGDLLDQLESSPASATLGVTSTSDEQLVSWPSWPAPEHHTADPPSPLDAVRDSANEATVEDIAAQSPPEGTPSPAPVPSPVPVPVPAAAAEECDDGWVTFINHSTGRTLRLPAHTKEEKAARWRGPGAWTSQEDLLDDQAQRIIDAIQPLPNKTRPSGPQWWNDGLKNVNDLGCKGEQGVLPPAAAGVTLPAGGLGEQQGTHHPALPADWYLPAFPSANTATPHPKGRPHTPRPEVTSPPPRRPRGKTRPRAEAVRRHTGQGQGPSLDVLLAFGFVALMAWLVRGGDSLLATLM